MTAKQVVKIAKLRKQYDESEDKINKLKEQIEALPLIQEYNKLGKEQEEIGNAKREAENSYREYIIMAYKQSDEKKYLGAQVKILTEVEFDDKNALEWALEHNHINLLQINKTEFKKIAKVLKPDFVKIVESPRGYINSDLSEFLES